MLHKIKAIVLQQIAYSDTHAIVQLYTDEFGRMSYLLPLAKKKKGSSMRSLFYPLSLLDMEVDHLPLREIHRIAEARQSALLNTIPYDPIKGSISFFISELLSCVLREPERNESLFDYLVQTILFFDKVEDGKANFHIAFMIGLTQYLGFSPRLRTYHKGFLFDMENGVFVSPHHLSDTHQCLSSLESWYVVKICRMNFINLHTFRFSKEIRMQIIEMSLLYYKIHHQEVRSIRSLDVLKDLFD